MSPRLLRPRASGLVATDPDARTYISAVQIADASSLEPAVQRAIDDFVKGCKADGIWSAIKASCILAGARTLSGALVPLVGSAPTNNGPFVSGDYNRKTGLKGNGTSKILDTNRNNNADPQDSQHVSFYVTEIDSSSSGVASHIGMGIGQNSDTHIVWNNTSTVFFFRSRTLTAISGSATTRQTGLHAISRASGTTVDVLLPGLSSSVSSNSSSAQSGTIKAFGRDATPYFNGRASFYSVGESLNLALLDTRVTNLYNAIGAAIP
jgi:hypothetical protein